MGLLRSNKRYGRYSTSSQAEIEFCSADVYPVTGEIRLLKPQESYYYVEVESPISSPHILVSRIVLRPRGGEVLPDLKLTSSLLMGSSVRTERRFIILNGVHPIHKLVYGINT